MNEQKINYLEKYPNANITDVIPKNQQVVIKKVICGISSLLLINKEMKNVKSDGVLYIVVSSSVEDYKEGDRILVNPNVLNDSTYLHGINNPNTLTELNKAISELPKEERLQYNRVNPKVNIIEFYVVSPFDILCKIK